MGFRAAPASRCLATLASAWVGLSLLGCATTQRNTVGPWRLEHSEVRSIAVAPLTNLSSNASAGQVISDAIATELFSREGIEIVDATKVGLNYLGPIERSRAREIGEQLHVDAVVYGTVIEYQYVRAGGPGSGKVPSIGVNARLVSSSTGAVLWAAGIVSTQSQLLSYDSIPIGELAQQVAEWLVDDLQPHLGRGSGAVATPTPDPDGAMPADVVEVPDEPTPDPDRPTPADVVEVPDEPTPDPDRPTPADDVEVPDEPTPDPPADSVTPDSSEESATENEPEASEPGSSNQGASGP